jgi:hypothetical protein
MKPIYLKPDQSVVFVPMNDEPTYTIDGEIYYWDVSIYEGYLRMQGRLN